MASIHKEVFEVLGKHRSITHWQHGCEELFGDFCLIWHMKTGQLSMQSGGMSIPIFKRRVSLFSDTTETLFTSINPGVFGFPPSSLKSKANNEKHLISIWVNKS